MSAFESAGRYNSLVATRAMNTTKRIQRADKDFFLPANGITNRVYSKTQHNVLKLGLITPHF